MTTHSTATSQDGAVPGPTPGTAEDGPAHRSPMLARDGAVPATGSDAGVADHYGDPLREQRAAQQHAAVVDRSHRGVIRITGPDRLPWLHSITSQHLEALPPMRGSEALVLSPHGHVEHHLLIADDGTATWLDVEPGTAGPLLGYLESMRFLLRVEPVDVSVDYCVLSLIGPASADVVSRALGPLDGPLGQPVTAPGTASHDDVLVQGLYPLARAVPAPRPGEANGPADPGTVGALVRAMPYGVDLLIPRAELTEAVERLRSHGAALAGIGAFEAARVAGFRPRLGCETDHRTIPHEVGWLSCAVHLDKGCYRGQETVARVHNLGRPPRRMALLHIDGTIVSAGAPVTAAGRTVGFVGTSVMHSDLGPIALALLKRTIPDDAVLVITDPEIGDVAASIDPSARVEQPTRPAGRVG